MKYNPFIHIRSSKFVVLPGEAEELVNEGMYGKSLALYLKAELPKIGYSVPFICCEDWGWWVEIAGQPFAFGLCIYGQLNEKTKELELSTTVSPEEGRRWSWSRFRFVDTTAAVQKLHADVVSIFEKDPDVRILGINEDPYWE